MDRKKLIWIGTFAGGFIGSYIPAIWGDGVFSMSSLIFSALGSVVGIYLGFKMGD